MTLFVAGLNHKTASVDLRESLAVEEDKLGDVLRDVQMLGVATELLILSTCNRVEVYGVAEAPGSAREVSMPPPLSRCSTPTSTAMPCGTSFGSPPASTRWCWASRRSLAR